MVALSPGDRIPKINSPDGGDQPPLQSAASAPAPEGRATEVNQEAVDVDHGVLLADACAADRARTRLAACCR
jgi:hypothetical protein